MDDFVVSGSDSDESYSGKKKKSKGRSKSYREASWDSEITSDDSYTKKKSSKKSKAPRTKNTNKKPKSKPKYKRYSDDSDVEYESTTENKTNILDEEDEPIGGTRRTRGKRTKYNLILDDSSESEAEKAKGAGKHIENCVDSTEEEYDAKEEEDISEEDADEYMDDDSKEKSEYDSGDINEQVQIHNERTSTQT